MPREQTLPRRISGTKEPARFILIASEGMRTETQYFQALEKHCDQNKVHPILITRSEEESGLSAPQHVLAQMRKSKKLWKPQLKKGDQFWLVLDVDSWSNLPDILEKCESEGIQLAVSNACFELWLLLHLIDIRELDSQTQAQMLENEKISDNHTFTSSLHGETMKDVTGRNFSKRRANAPALMPYVQEAIKRAKELTGDEVIPSGLGSSVYRIAEQIQLTTPQIPNS